MNQLTQMSCTPYQPDERAATEVEIAAYQPLIPDWKLTAPGGIRRLERIFSFKDFAQALAFTNQIGHLAEAEGHHPTIQTEWGRVTVTWWTHKVNGLHRNDFIMAAKTDAVYAGSV